MTTDGLTATRAQATREGAGRAAHEGVIPVRGRPTTTVPVIPLWERLPEGGRR
jgi:hypothetical protein